MSMTTSEHIFRRYPVDVRALNKGDILSVAQVETAVSTKFEHRKFALAACRLAGWVEDEKRRQGEHVTVITVKGEIHVLTDSKAAEYQARRFEEHEAGLRRATRKKAHIDRSQLTAEELAVHDRGLSVMAAKLTRLRAKDPELKPAERATPLRAEQKPRGLPKP